MSTIKVSVEHTPNLYEYQLTNSKVWSYVAEIPACTFYLWDNNYWTVSLIDWNTVLIDVLKSMPAYTVDRFDCEDFALLTASRVLERYKLNTCGIAVGQTSMGYHGWNVIITPEEAIYFEPQTGQFIELNEDYKANILIIG